MIYLFDIHSTIYDEAKEYVPALKILIEKIIEESKKGIPDREKFYENIYADLKIAHIDLQNDWDLRAFDVNYMPTLRSLFTNDEMYHAAKKLALSVHHSLTIEFIKNASYSGIVDFLKKLKEDGHQVFLCSDGNLNAIENTIEALQLNNIIDGCYCCASLCQEPLVNENPKIKLFSVGSFKPNARMIGEIIIDYAKKNDLVPQTYSFENAFSIEQANNIKLKRNKWMQQKLIPKDEIMQNLLNKTVMVGDSWRDIVLGKNAGVLTIEAGYGAKPKQKLPDYDVLKKESDEVIEKTSHWNATYGPKQKRIDRLHLFSDPKEKEMLLKKNKPDIVCDYSITEISHFSRRKHTSEEENVWKRLHQEKFTPTLEKISLGRK